MSDDGLCMVCLWRRDGFTNGLDFPVHRGTKHGISYLFEADILVCDEHVAYADFDGAHPLDVAGSADGEAV